MIYVLKGTSEDIRRIEKGTAILFQDLQICSGEETLQIEVCFQDTDTLSVNKEGNRIQISCRETAHYFRGLNWILHQPDQGSVHKEEPVIFPKNGYMMDCSRNSVFTVEKVKSFIRIMAKLGMNDLLLYTEDTYEVPEEPYFGTYRGRYSQDEIRELDAYAQLFGIELIPCIQTLAHLRNALKWPMGKALKDTDDILFVGKEEVYQFIEELLHSVKASFSTRRVHLGMDEAVTLGLGNYLMQNGYKKSSELIKEHSSRVFEICKKLDLEPMIWSDMYITSNTGSTYYDTEAIRRTTEWVKPDAGLGLVYWDYYNDDPSIYHTLLEAHENLSDRTIFAGGSWIWNGIAPNYSRTFACTCTGLQACREHHLKEVFCTGWLDNGSETPVDAVYPGLVLFAHLGFHEEPDQAELAEEFAITVNGRLEDFYQLDRFDALFAENGVNITSDNPSKYLLYQDNLLGMFDYHIQGIDTAQYYGALAKRLEACAGTSPAYQELFAYYHLLAEVLSEKADLGIRIKKAYDQKDLSTLEEICEKVIPCLTEKMWNMKLLREQLWMQDAKPFGYELMDIKLGGVITRLESSRRRLRSWLDGTVTVLEELEQPRLPYFPTEQSLHHDRNVSLCENQWNKIVSGCCLIDTI
ncbi:MAG: beta-N-acetylhexosaminidase [Lachnospiraceae bacterium]|nr:beta-N-acetylhexosaminidase [Lachnospiraceae bacterium]